MIRSYGFLKHSFCVILSLNEKTPCGTVSIEIKRQIYQLLIENRKQVVVIYAYGHLGREVWEMKKGIFKAALVKFGVDLAKK